MAAEEQNTPSKTKKKFYKRPVFWVIAVILVIIISATGSGDQNNKTDTANNPTDTTSTASTTPEQKQSTAEPATTTPAKPTETVSQKNAVRKAKDYLSYTAFSHDGLVAQLEFEKFSHEDAKPQRV